MVVRNEMDRYHLAMDVIERVPVLGPAAAHATQAFREKLIEHQAYIRQWGDDPPEIRDRPGRMAEAPRAFGDAVPRLQARQLVAQIRATGRT